MIALILAQIVGLCAAMALAWWFQWRRGNAGWVDVFWTFATGAAGVAGALWPMGGAFPLRQGIVALLAAFWAVRLGLHLRARVLTRHEDARYAGFRRDWGDQFQARLFGFLMIQASAAWPLAIAILVAARNPVPGLQIADFAALLVSASAIVGEGIADRELARFVADPKNKGRVCDRGLWAWSRHPNYFFEFLGWCAWPLFGFGWSWGWAALVAPVWMYWLLVYVSGIPPLEKVMLESRGDAWREYESRTSPFWPLPPKKREVRA
jgi:steroid 5-alpha reductase family enzyme